MKFTQISGDYAALGVALRLKPDDATAYVTLPQSDDAEAYYNKGNAKYRLGQYEAAISGFDIVIRLKPDFPEAYYKREQVKDTPGEKWKEKWDQRQLERKK